MATVANTIKLPGGASPSSAAVEIELVASTTARAAGWVAATDVTILATYRPTVTSGAWTADLTPNADLNPSGTVYRINEYVDGKRYTHYIEVGSGGGSVHDLLVDAPGSLATAGSEAFTTAAVAAHAALTSGAHAATAVTVADAGGLFTSTTVETALAELATNRVTLQASNGVDDSAQINGALAAFTGTISGKIGESYLISTPLIIRSGTTLDMTGCSITLKAGSNCNMVQNTAVATTNRSVVDAAISVGSSTLTSSSASFTSADAGRSVVVAGALDSAGNDANGPLCATIRSVSSSTTATISKSATATVSGAAAAIYDRDSDITVVGGTWDRGSNSGVGVNNHSLRFRRVDRLTVKGARFLSSSGKYAVSIGSCTNSICDSLNFSTSSDGVHVVDCVGGYVKNVSGTTGDDMVAFTCREGGVFSVYEDVAGNIADFVVDGVFCDGSLTAFKFLAGAGTTIRGCTVRNIRGTTTNSIGILLNNTAADGTVDPSDIGGILVEDVDVSPGSYCFQLSSTATRDVKFREIACRSSVSRIFTSSGTHETLDIDGVTVAAATNIVLFLTGGTIRQAAIRNLRSYGSLTGVLGVWVQGSATIEELSVKGVRMHKASNGDALIYNSAGTISRLNVDDVIFSGGGRILRVESGAASTTTYANISNVSLSTGWDLAQIAKPVELSLSNVRVDAIDSGALVKLIGPSASLVVRSGGAVSNPAGRAGVSRDGTQVVRVVAPSFPADVSILAKNNGDAAYNTNAGLSCGVGPVISDGSSWKNVYSGATY